jgi:hypothetical protein
MALGWPSVEWGLAHISSWELSEWEAYEREYGPVNNLFQSEVLAQIHELIQQLNRITGAAHFTNKTHRKNPVPEPKKVPRPWIHEEQEDPEDPDREDEDDDE